MLESPDVRTCESPGLPLRDSPGLPLRDSDADPPLPDVRIVPDLAQHRVEVGDVTLATISAGSGGVPLLLVHGFTGAKEDFAWHMEALAQAGYHVVAPDLRGHGESDAPNDESAYSLVALADDIAALIQALGWTRPVVLGHSMGGMVVQLLALRRPELVGALVLMDTSPGPPDGLSAPLAEAAARVARDAGMVALLEAQRALGDSAPMSSEAFIRVLNKAPGYREFADRKFLASAAAMYAALAPEILHQPDRVAALAALDVPTLVMVGSQDESFIGPSQRMTDVIAGARLVTIPDAGHSPQFENGPAWFEQLLTFLREQDGSRP
jgi:pimeloyl-ACP methyl ester carboxylesterase